MPDGLHGFLYTAAALITLVWVGNGVCKLILKLTGLSAAMQRRKLAADAAAQAQANPVQINAFDARVGGAIGAFERLILAIGILAGSWEVLAAVVALKTVARFKELDERLDAEYFLVGSLFSILWAVLVTGAWAAYDKAWGLDIGGHLATFLKD